MKNMISQVYLLFLLALTVVLSQKIIVLTRKQTIIVPVNQIATRAQANNIINPTADLKEIGESPRAHTSLKSIYLIPNTSAFKSLSTLTPPTTILSTMATRTNAPQSTTIPKNILPKNEDGDVDAACITRPLVWLIICASAFILLA
jgi:hypothetical protein